MTTAELHEILDDENRKLTADELKEVVYQLKQDTFEKYGEALEAEILHISQFILAKLKHLKFASIYLNIWEKQNEISTL